MATATAAQLDGISLDAWRAYLQSHASILRVLDAELVAEQGITTRDYEVLLYLNHAPEQRLAMSAVASRTMLTRSGVTRLIDGLVAGGFVERIACPDDARVCFAQLTGGGARKLREAGATHVAGIRRLFLEHFDGEEIAQLSRLLGRLPGAQEEGSCTAQ